jgi:ethanolamine ammonia-lyase small subunit
MADIYSINQPHKVDCQQLVISNPWQGLKQFTDARIALGRAGSSIPTSESLSFQLDHARAIDAVHCALDIPQLVQALSSSQLVADNTPQPPMVVNSKATDRVMYLQRPDLGRQLNEASWQALVDYRHVADQVFDLAIVVADGLSSTAIQRHAVPVIECLLAELADDAHDWSIAPITVVSQGRVAAGDDVGECLKAKIVMILIGERPGLTSPDSMGFYMTWHPLRGAKESSRNCISNIRPEGLTYNDASRRACYLLRESLKLGISGIELKDRSSTSDDPLELDDNQSQNFLLLNKSN